MSDHRSIVVTACDSTYYPLARGLFLSLIETKIALSGIELGFVDIGCGEQELRQLKSYGVQISAMDQATLGELSGPQFGYRRAQICRPFLPQLFPNADVLIWADSDVWFQDAAFISILAQEAMSHPGHIFISPEIHYAYKRINDQVLETRRDLRKYYSAIYGPRAGDTLSLTPTLNSGLFAMSATNTLWRDWQQQILDIYGHQYEVLDETTRHFAEQISLNWLIKAGAPARCFDPLYNYLCLWEPPYRDQQGVVRLSNLPNLPVGVVHLAGGWKHFGQLYTARGLLYKAGAYLTPDEETALTALAEVETEQFR